MSDSALLTKVNIGWVLQVIAETDSAEEGVTEFDSRLYVCSTVAIMLGVNAIPIARVSVFTGTSIWTNASQNVKDDLFTHILNRQLSGEQVPGTLLKANLYPESALDIENIGRSLVTQAASLDESQAVFSGYITTASLYLGGTSMSHDTIDLVIAHRAALLDQVVVGQVYGTSGAGLVSLISDTSGKMLEKKLHAHDAMGYSTSNINKDATLDERLASLVDEVVSKKLSSMGQATDKDQVNYGALVKDCIFSKTKVCGELVQDWDNEVHYNLATTISGLGLFSAAVRVLNSENFMLNFYPRWKSRDFKLELGISHAWDGKAAFTLTSSDIIRVMSNFTPGNTINNPDVILVDYNYAVKYSVKWAQEYKVPFRPGVYTPNDKLAAKIKNAYDANGKTDITAESEVRYKCRLYQAPKWVLPWSLRGSNTNIVEFYRALNSTKNSSDATETSDSKLKIKNPGEVADNVAQSLYTFLYGSQDSCAIELNPTLAFNVNGKCLEDHIGDCIDIKLSDSLTLRGVITNIAYNWKGAATGAAAGYQLNITRLRKLNGKEKAIACTLYTT